VPSERGFDRQPSVQVGRNMTQPDPCVRTTLPVFGPDRQSSAALKRALLSYITMGQKRRGPVALGVVSSNQSEEKCVALFPPFRRSRRIRTRVDNNNELSPIPRPSFRYL